jgi:tRNA1(Val) A37 N6-methylase TrmN6
MFSQQDLTCDAFLGGQVHLYQPKNGYRAGVDPVLLAASVNAVSGQSVLELGCGVGAASLCLAARVAGLDMTGIERQADYADLAVKNAAKASARLSVVVADIADLPVSVRQIQFDHVIANPPYYHRGRGTAARDQGREAALGEDTPLDVWMQVAAKRLAPKGYVHIIQKAERLPDLLAACTSRLGSIEVLPLQPRTGRKAELVLLRARAGGRAAFKLHAPLILHDGVSHGKDQEDYTPLVRAVLRDGAALGFGQ